MKDRQTKHSNLGALLVYVDDTIATWNDEKEKEVLKQCQNRKFEIKEFERLKYFHRIKVSYSRQEIFILQQNYIANLLKETGKCLQTNL